LLDRARGDLQPYALGRWGSADVRSHHGEFTPGAEEQRLASRGDYLHPRRSPALEAHAEVEGQGPKLSLDLRVPGLAGLVVADDVQQAAHGAPSADRLANNVLLGVILFEDVLPADRAVWSHLGHTFEIRRYHTRLQRERESRGGPRFFRHHPEPHEIGIFSDVLLGLNRPHETRLPACGRAASLTARQRDVLPACAHTGIPRRDPTMIWRRLRSLMLSR
jgi:hypothetical protein